MPTYSCAVALPEFFGCQGTSRAPEFRLGHLQKIMRSFIFLVEAISYTVRTNFSTHGRKNSFLQENGTPPLYKTMLEIKPSIKPIEFGQWMCRKQSAGLISAASFGMYYVAAAAASKVKQAQAAAAV